MSNTAVTRAKGRKAATFLIAPEILEAIRREAFETRRTKTEIIEEQLLARYPDIQLAEDGQEEVPQYAAAAA